MSDKITSTVGRVIAVMVGTAIGSFCAGFVSGKITSRKKVTEC